MNYVGPLTPVRYDSLNVIINSGIVFGTVNDNNQLSYFWCSDIRRALVIGCCYEDSAFINDTLNWILNKYPADPALSSTEKAAINAAIWQISDDLPIRLIRDTTVRRRAKEILDSASMYPTSAQMLYMRIIQDQFDPEIFRIETKDQNQNPFSVNGIHIYLTGNGWLSTSFVNTNPDGLSNPIISSGTTNGSLLRASFPYDIPAGLSFSYNNCIGLIPEPGQRMVLGRTIHDSIEAELGTEVLPVELSSFFSILTDNSVSLVWTTEGETNNRMFEIERRTAAGWVHVGEVEGNGTTTAPKTYSFTDRNLQSGTYSYRLKQIDFNGNFEYHNLNEEVSIGSPEKFELHQNYPNPFNPATKINFSLPTSGNVKLKIFDVSGKEVVTLVNENKPAGYHSVEFNGMGLASGMYFYRIETTGYTETKKMILMK